MVFTAHFAHFIQIYSLQSNWLLSVVHKNWWTMVIQQWAHILFLLYWNRVIKWFVCHSVCCLMTPDFSKDIQYHVGPYFVLCLHITKITHQATSKIGKQPRYCRWPLWCSSEVCVDMYGLTRWSTMIVVHLSFHISDITFLFQNMNISCNK